MQNEPWKILLLLGIGLYVAKLWLDDFLAQRKGHPSPRALPGATPSPWKAVVVAAVGGVVLVAAESWGEIRLGIAGEQTKISALFALYTLVAAVIEEVIFRGFIVVEKRGPWLLWGSAIVASVLFAGLHPFLWQWENGHLTWTFGVKGWFSTAAVFAGSLWFYFVRFARFNPQRSLLPCFAAHASKNLGVIVIKAAQGFLVGWW
jgi:membrane protease YdiL (CAAX protease family)